jgi:hypothetical protein
MNLIALFPFIALVILLAPTAGHGQNYSFNEPTRKDALKALREAIRDERRTRPAGDEAASQRPSELRAYRVVDVQEGRRECRQCDPVLSLIDQVNTILVAMEPELPTTQQHAIGELIALRTYSSLADHSVAGPGPCHRRDHSIGLSREFGEFDLTDAVMIASGEVDFNAVQSLIFHGREQGHKIIYLRGTGVDVDKLVRVEMRSEQNPVVSILQLTNLPDTPIYTTQIEKVQASLPGLGADPPAQQERGRAQGTRPESEDGEAPSFRFFELDTDRRGLPRKLTVFEFEHDSRLSDTLQLQHHFELSSRAQELVTSITTDENVDLVRFVLDVEGDLKAEIPLRLNYPTSVVTGQLTIDDRLGVRSSVAYHHSDRSQTNFDHRSGNRGSTGVTHTRALSDFSRLSLRVEESSQLGRSVTLSYRLMLR